MTPHDPDYIKPPSYSFWLGALVVRGSVTPRILPDVLGFGALAFLTVVFTRLAVDRYGVNLAVPVGPFEAAGAVLGLLLVLRFNAGYDRWWEARKLWGGIVNQSRNLAIAALSYGPENIHWRVTFVRWAATMPHVIRRSLRGEHRLPEIERLLDPETAARIAAADHMPDIVARELGRLLQLAKLGGMDKFAFLEAERQRSLLIDYLGGCERILKTPLSRSSVVLVRRFILLFLATLPFALLNDLEDRETSLWIYSGTTNPRVWLVPLFVMMMAYPLLALDRLGRELQNPFLVSHLDHLPLDEMCTTIERNLLELLNADAIAADAAPGTDTVEPPPDAVARVEHLPADIDIS